MKEKKYEIIRNYYIKVGGTKLYHIRALRDFGSVRAGELGGCVASYENLSQQGNCWVDYCSSVSGNSIISDDAIIKNGSAIFDSYVSGNSIIDDAYINNCSIDGAIIRYVHLNAGCIKGPTKIENNYNIIVSLVGNFELSMYYRELEGLPEKAISIREGDIEEYSGFVRNFEEEYSPLTGGKATERAFISFASKLLI